MKKVLCAVLALMMVLSLCACGETAVEKREPITVGTLPVNFDDPAALVEAMVPTSFEAKDLKTAEDGSMTLDVDIYVQVMYDAVDISQLQKGDTFFDADGNEMEVTSVEYKDDFFMVNGGLDKGGVTLFSLGGGTYMQVNSDGFVAVFDCGKATYPVNAECYLIDSTEGVEEDVTVTAGEIADYLKNDTIGFGPNTTTLVIENGEITQIVRNNLAAE